MGQLVSVYKDLENCSVVWGEGPHKGIDTRIEMSMEHDFVTNENVLSGFHSWGARVIGLVSGG